MIVFVQQGKKCLLNHKINQNLTMKYGIFHYRLAQSELSEQLDSLIAQLRSIEDIQQTSPQFDTYVHKLINIKHKVTVIYSILQGAQVLSKSI